VDFVVEDSRGPLLATFKTQKEAIDGAEEESFTSGCRASGFFTRKSPTTGAPPSRRGVSFRTLCGLKGPYPCCCAKEANVRRQKSSAQRCVNPIFHLSRKPSPHP